MTIAPRPLHDPADLLASAITELTQRTLSDADVARVAHATARLILGASWQLLTIAQTCERLQCSEPMLTKWERSGQLVPLREGRWVRYSTTTLAAFIAELAGQESSAA